MLTYSMETGGQECLYAALYRHMREDILAGRLQEGEKLPSKRSLARHLGLSNTTVEAAYLQLVTEGYVRAEARRGFFVLPLVRRTPPVRLPTQIQAMEAPSYFVDFCEAAVPTERFPFALWLRLLRQVMSTEQEDTLLTHRPAEGLWQLREAIAGHLASFRGMPVAPEQIIVGAGTESLYALLVQLLGRGRVYGMEDPGYPKLRRIYHCNDVQCTPLPMDDKGVIPDAVRQFGVEVLHITPSHHFPTGLVMPVGRRHALLSWAEESPGRYLIEDDYDCEFRLSGNPIPSLQSIDRSERVIYINSFSQSLAPAFRMSYLVLPPHLVARFRAELSFYAGTVSCLEQLTLARFISGGHFEKHLSRMRTYYRGLRDALLAAIAESPLAPICEIRAEEAGVHFLLALHTTHSEAEIKARGKAEGLHLGFVSDYRATPTVGEPPILTMHYTGMRPEQIPEVLQRLGRVLL